jgi:hypothetical protein
MCHKTAKCVTKQLNLSQNPVWTLVQVLLVAAQSWLLNGPSSHSPCLCCIARLLIGSVSSGMRKYILCSWYPCCLRGTWNLEGGSYTGDFERGIKEGSRNGTSVCERFQRGFGGRTSLLRTLKGMLSKAQKWASTSIGVPRWGNL